MAGRKVRDEEEAVALVEEAERRGLKPSEVAAERGVDGRSVQAWRMTLARRDKPRDGFLELVPMTAEGPRLYRVRVGELVIEVGGDFETDTLHRLVGALRGC